MDEDRHYLGEYADAFRALAARTPHEAHQDAFERFANGAIEAELGMVHDHYQHQEGAYHTKKRLPTTLAYCRFLRHHTANQPVAVGMASMLPCAWMYSELGLHMARHATPNNPYSRWFEAYASPGFARDVQHEIDILTHYAALHPEHREEMMHAFFTSCWHEEQFWEGAYHHPLQHKKHRPG